MPQEDVDFILYPSQEHVNNSPVKTIISHNYENVQVTGLKKYICGTNTTRFILLQCILFYQDWSGTMYILLVGLYVYKCVFLL